MDRKKAEKLINEVQAVGAARGWNMLDKLLDLIDRTEKIEREACAKLLNDRAAKFRSKKFPHVHEEKAQLLDYAAELVRSNTHMTDTTCSVDDKLDGE